MIIITKTIDNNGDLIIEERYLNERFCISKIGSEIILFDSCNKEYYRYELLEDTLKIINMDNQEDSINFLKNQLGKEVAVLVNTTNGDKFYKVANSSENLLLEVEYTISYNTLLQKTCYDILNKVEEKHRLFAFNLDQNEILSYSKMELLINNQKTIVNFKIDNILEKEIPNDLKDILSKYMSQF